MTSPDRPRLLLIDAFSLIHQAFHAVPDLTNREGLPTNALYGFTNMVLAVIEEHRPAGLALAFDTKEPTFRHERYPAYKAERPPMDERLVVQLPIFDELVEAFRWAQLRQPGFEADDILGTLAVGSAAAWQVLILTGDRDLCQLATDDITILATRGRGVGDLHRFDPAAVTERYGVPPSRLPDWKALVGDKSDNLPGVPGIGEKTATALLQAHGDLESVLAAAETVGGKRGQALVEHREAARLWRELATIRCDVPLAATATDLRRKEPDEEAVGTLFRQLGFHSLQRRLSPRTVAAPRPVSYQLIQDRASAERVAAEVAEAGCVGLAAGAAPRCLAVATGDARAWLILLAPAPGRQMALFDEPDATAATVGRDLIELVCAPLVDGRARFVCHDLQHLTNVFAADWPGIAGYHGDTHLAAWLLDPERAEHPVDGLATRHLAALPPAEPGAADEVDPAAWAVARTADLCRRLEPLLAEELEAERLLDLYRQMELPAAPVLGRMMAWGLLVDPDHLQALDQELDERLTGLRQAVYTAAGRELNLDSPKQVSALLYEELGLPAGRRVQHGYSTDAATLQRLVGHHPVVGALLDYRELAKLKSTYTEALQAACDDTTGRIRTRLNQTGTATGRLSSSQPNLQNIPARGDWGNRIRDAFVAPPGWLLLAADYSQIELRVLAHLSGDQRLRQAFLDDEDVHTAAAVEIFGVEPTAVTSDMRRQAKVLNFGIAYGIQAHGLATRLEIDRAEAAALIEAYFARFPLVKQYADDTIARAKERGWVQTMFGRRRRLADLGHAQMHRRQAAERAAINMPIQGTAADIIKRAMLTLEEQLAIAGLASRQVLQVHDELLLEVARDELPTVAALCRQAMISAARLEVPLVVKQAVGDRWGSLQERV